MSKKRRCVGCKEFFDKEFMYFQSSVQAFCSQKCFNHQREKNTPRHKSSKQIPKFLRKQIKKRDNFKCRMCPVVEHRRGHLALHHIKYRSEGGKHIKENLITLCYECHKEVHSNKGKYQSVLLRVVEAANKGKLVTVGDLIDEQAQEEEEAT